MYTVVKVDIDYRKIVNHPEELFIKVVTLKTVIDVLDIMALIKEKIRLEKNKEICEKRNFFVKIIQTILKQIVKVV